MNKYYVQMVKRNLPKPILRRLEIPFEDHTITICEIEAENLLYAISKAKRENPNLRIDENSLV